MESRKIAAKTGKASTAVDRSAVGFSSSWRQPPVFVGIYNKTVLDGRALLLQHCQGKNAEADSTITLFVGNVHLSVREEDLRERFSPFGRVKHLTLPPVPLGNKRGFAFVEYATEDEAQNALQAMANTSMHGWPLVIEGAKESKKRKHGHLE
ncbi:hypothetical protein NL676_001063 [Syzygium grande]|nr:hypothetical protein NL676_001063 [Syzygium grande]